MTSSLCPKGPNSHAQERCLLGIVVFLGPGRRTRLTPELQCPKCAKVRRARSWWRELRRLGRHVRNAGTIPWSQAKVFREPWSQLAVRWGRWGEGQAGRRAGAPTWELRGWRRHGGTEVGRVRLEAASRGLGLTVLQELYRPPTPLAPFSNWGVEGVTLLLGAECHLDLLAGQLGRLGAGTRGGDPLTFGRRSFHPRSWAVPPQFIFILLSFIFNLPYPSPRFRTLIGFSYRNGLRKGPKKSMLQGSQAGKGLCVGPTVKKTRRA